jgi:hypothetical protein
MDPETYQNAVQEKEISNTRFFTEIRAGLTTFFTMFVTQARQYSDTLKI